MFHDWRASIGGSVCPPIAMLARCHDVIGFEMAPARIAIARCGISFEIAERLPTSQKIESLSNQTVFFV